MAGAEIGEPAARTVHQRRGVLSACAAEPFGHEKRHRVAGFYPLFHAAALWQTQGGNTLWVPVFLACAAFLLTWAIGQALMDEYDMLGVPDEVL